MISIAGHMRPLGYSKKELIFMLMIIPPFAVWVSYTMFGMRYFSSLYMFLGATLPVMILLMGVYILCGMVAALFLIRFPKYRNTFRRIGFSLIAYIFITMAGLTLLFWGYDYAGYMDYTINMNDYLLVMGVGVFLNVLSTSMNEGAAFYEKWRELADEAEQLKKVNLQSQLEGLKGQVNPHFLFNSLNSLSSLISDEPERAEKFVDEMSKVYRYLLRNNEDGLVTLEAEMQFIQSYFHMLKTRYGDTLQLETNINPHCLQNQLPPLTLQMLVENAVKHNMMLKDSPLKIMIMTTNSGRLIVCNNLQRKVRNVSSNKVGLSNIINKYRLMNQEDIMINDDGKEFLVVIPLLPAKEAPVSSIS
jgi:sensor histidine kinase YesM